MHNTKKNVNCNISNLAYEEKRQRNKNVKFTNAVQVKLLSSLKYGIISLRYLCKPHGNHKRKYCSNHSKTQLRS